MIESLSNLLHSLVGTPPKLNCFLDNLRPLLRATSSTLLEAQENLEVEE